MVTLPPLPALAGYALQALVAAQALRLARLRPLHIPFAALAALVAVVDPLRPLLASMRAARHPHAGAALLSWHLDRALWASWPVGLACVAWTSLAGRRAWPHLVGAAGLALAVQVATYPASAAPLVLPMAHGAALLSALVAVAIWAKRKRWPGETERIVLVYLAAEVASWPLVYLGGDARASWPLSWSAYLCATIAALVSQGAWARAIEREASTHRA